MVIWRITGDSIGPNSCGAAHFVTKEEAEKNLREHKQWCRDQGRSFDGHGPEKIVIKNREDLAWHLDAVMGYGGS